MFFWDHLNAKKSVSAAYVRTYFITLSLNLSSASVVAAAEISLLHNGYTNFPGRHSLEKLYGPHPPIETNERYGGKEIWDQAVENKLIERWCQFFYCPLLTSASQPV